MTEDQNDTEGRAGGTEDGGDAKAPGILFDVDGTLVDTNYLHTLAWARAIRDAGRWAPMNAIHRLVGMGGDNLLESLFGEDLPAASEARKERYAALIGEARPFPEAAALLRRTHSAGLRVVLASSSPADELDQIRSVIDADDSIDEVTSADEVERSKPDPGVFEAALEVGRIDRDLTLVIGDSVWDVQAARAAGLACIGVETGGFSAHELREEGAMAVYRDVAEILAQFMVSPIAALMR